jgi:hypothetical protein
MAAQAPRVQWSGKPCVNRDAGAVLIVCASSQSLTPGRVISKKMSERRAFGSASAGAGLRLTEARRSSSVQTPE